MPETASIESAVNQRVTDVFESYAKRVEKAVLDLHELVWQEYRKGKLDVEEYNSTGISAQTSLEVQPAIMDVFRVTAILYFCPTVPGTIILGRRRIPVAANVAMQSMATGNALKLYGNDQRIIYSGTPEALGAAQSLTLWLLGTRVPSPAVGII